MKVKFKKHYFRRTTTIFLAVLLSFSSLLNLPLPAFADETYKIVVVQSSGAIVMSADYSGEIDNTKFTTIIRYNQGEHDYNVRIDAGTKTIAQNNFDTGILTTDGSNTAGLESFNLALEVRNSKNETIGKVPVSNMSAAGGKASLTISKIEGGYHYEGESGTETASGDITDAEAESSAVEHQQTDGLALTDSSEDKTALNKCKKKLGILGLGWLLCPLTLSAAEGVSSLYEDIQKNYMNVRPSLFSNKLSETWGTFRDWANLIFIVLFFIVIISQLTGFGIDNYGIKRILPRIIVGAILINLSYIVCQLAIDVSNIIGSGLLGFLDPGSGGGGPADNYIAIQLASGQVRIDIQGLNTGILIVILLCLVVALLSTIILWVFCLVRDIGIVVATCLAPIAFAANLLPNTEGFYKKWFSLAKILLMLYPVCALTVGAGALVSHILSEINPGWLMQLAAVLAATLPFVAIPYLLLNMLSAFGTIGNKLAGLGRRTITAGAAAGLAGRGIKRAYKNSNFAYNRQENKARKIDMKRVNQARRISDRLSRQDPATLSNRQLERLARANQNIDKYEERQGAINYATSAGYLERRKQGRENTERRKREEDYMAMIANGKVTDTQGNDIYNRGTNIEAMTNRLFDLYNMGDNISDAEMTERGALTRQLAKTKGGDGALINMLNPDTGRMETIRLNDNGIQALNRHRLENDDVAAVFGKKGGVTTRYLNDYASNQIHYIENEAGQRVLDDNGNAQVDWQYYTQQAFQDNTDIAAQSTGELRRYARHMDYNQLNELAENERLAEIIPDYEKRQVIINARNNRPEYIAAQRAQAAQQQENERAAAAQAQQNEDHILRVRQEEDAARRGRVQQNIGGQPQNVYQVPRGEGGFRGNGRWTTDRTTGDHIYTEEGNSRAWNGSTGRYTQAPSRGTDEQAEQFDQHFGDGDIG